MAQFRQLWDIFGHTTRGRSLLQTIGLWDIIVSIAATIATTIWSAYKQLGILGRVLFPLGVFIACELIILLLVEIHRRHNETPQGPKSDHIRDFRPDRISIIRPKLLGTVFISVIIVGALWTGAIDAAIDRLYPLPDAAIFVECDTTLLPIAFPPDGNLFVFGLRKRATSSLGEISGAPGKQWTTDAIIKAARLPNQIPPYPYHCVVSNHGPAEVLHTWIPFDVQFLGSDHTIYRSVVPVGGLSPGKSAEFYIVNDCKETASAILLLETVAVILGEHRNRNIVLHVPGRNVLERLRTLFPSAVSLDGNFCK